MSNELTCFTPLCNNPIGQRSLTKLCPSCYSYVYTNQKRTPRQLIQRSQKIQLFQSRLNFLLPQNTSLINTDKTKGTQPVLEYIPGRVKKFKRGHQYKKTG